MREAFALHFRFVTERTNQYPYLMHRGSLPRMYPNPPAFLCVVSRYWSILTPLISRKFGVGVDASRSSALALMSRFQVVLCFGFGASLVAKWRSVG